MPFSPPQIPNQQMINLSINSNFASPIHSINNPTLSATPVNSSPLHYFQPQSQTENEPESSSSDSSPDPAPYNANVDFEALENEERHQLAAARRAYQDKNFFLNDAEYYGDERYDGTSPSNKLRKDNKHHKPSTATHAANDYYNNDYLLDAGYAKHRLPAKENPRKPKKKSNGRQRYEEAPHYDAHRGRNAGSNPAKKTNKDRYFSGYSNHSRSQSGFDSDGWAAEDLMDVKNTEFDFQANNKLFNKVQVFDEIRQQDTTNPNERLVAFNKVRPNTTNYHQPQQKYGHREMVIKHDHNPRWAADDDDDKPNTTNDVQEDEDNELDESQILENSAEEDVATDDLDDLNDSDDPDDLNDSDDLDDSISNVSAILTVSPPSLPQLRRMSRPQMYTDVKFVGLNTGKTISCASPVQMVELERMTFMTFGISESILNENAARGIAEISLKTLGGISRFSYSNHNLSPTVVIFAGTARVGLRALAAGRHLANRQVHVIAVAIGYEETKNDSNDDDVLNAGRANVSDLKNQIKALTSSKARVVKNYQQFLNELRTIDSPPELIIDGLQGYQTTLDDFGEEDVATVVNCIEWANRQRAPIASLDIPSGLDGATGMTMSRGADSAIISSLSSDDHVGLVAHTNELRGVIHPVGAPSLPGASPKTASGLASNTAFAVTNGNKKLMKKKSRWPHINAKMVLSCGLPITGLENAYLTGAATPGEWKHYVVDIGLPTGALQKGPLRRFGKVWFGSDWIQQLDVVAK